jgi:hypothetical protein
MHLHISSSTFVYSTFVVKTSSSCPVSLFVSMWQCTKYNGDEGKLEGKLVCRENKNIYI